jgi:hypothetical protein
MPEPVGSQLASVEPRGRIDSGARRCGDASAYLGCPDLYRTEGPLPLQASYRSTVAWNIKRLSL